MITLGYMESFSFPILSEAIVKHRDPLIAGDLVSFDLSSKTLPLIINETTWSGKVEAGTVLTNTSSPDVRIAIYYKPSDFDH